MIEQDPPLSKPALPIVTIVLAALNIGAFALCLAAGADPLAPSVDDMFRFGGNLGAITLDGEPWRLFTSMFLHSGVLHLGINMFGLVDSGRHIERLYGRSAYLALYLFAGLVGSLASALSGQSVSVGASGAIFGIMGAWGAYLLTHRKALGKDELKRSLQGLAIFLGFNLWFGLSHEGIDMRAHIGGLGAGFIAGLVVAPGKSSLARIAMVFAASGGVIAATFVVPAPAPVRLPLAYEKLQQLQKLDSLVSDRFAALVRESKLDEDTGADAIEREVLPTWREAKVLASSIDGLTKAESRELEAYIDEREQALVAVVTSLRKRDSAGFATALNAVFASMKRNP